MDEVSLFEFIPSTMSAIATVAAAYAAFKSLEAANKATKVAEQSALATQHKQAADRLSESIFQLKDITECFSSFTEKLFTRWPREIGQYDNRYRGGENPRPLRHVLSNVVA